MNGGYDEGYKKCPCFWGSTPSSLVMLYDTLVGKFKGLHILDAGCGEGKNTAFFAQKGATVLSIDISPYAIYNAKEIGTDLAGVTWLTQDIRSFELPVEFFDVVVAYGLFHCLESRIEIEHQINRLQF